MSLDVVQQIRQLRAQICELSKGTDPNRIYPNIDSCPVGEENILLSNITRYKSDLNPYGFASISFADFYSCITSSLNTKDYRLQFIVDNPDSVVFNGDRDLIQLPSNDDTQMFIYYNNVLIDSFELYSDGSIMPRNRTDRSSYGVNYITDRLEINRFPGFVVDQMYVIRFTVAEASVYLPSSVKLLSTSFTASVDTTDTGPLLQLLGATIKWVQKEILPLKKTQYIFDINSGELTLTDTMLGAGETLFILYTTPL